MATFLGQAVPAPSYVYVLAVKQGRTVPAHITLAGNANRAGYFVPAPITLVVGAKQGRTVPAPLYLVCTVLPRIGSIVPAQVFLVGIKNPTYGFNRTVFSNPIGTQYFVVGESAKTTYFGVPNLYFPATAGFNSTVFGTQTGSQYSKVGGLEKTTYFGVPISPYSQTLIATGALLTEFGRPFMFYAVPIIEHRSCYAAGFYLTAFGAPVYYNVVTRVSASVAPGTIFGAPSVAANYQCVAYIPTTFFGVAAAYFRGSASGAQTTLFGAHTARHILSVSSSVFEIRYGLATARRAGDCSAIFIYARARFGRPIATLSKGAKANGARLTEFGAHTSAFRGKALHIPPGVYIGKPLMTRSVHVNV